MTIPSKLYYSISEVAEMTGVKPHVLRYWESEFSDLHPKKNRAGNRSYRDKDIRTVLTIRDLLYQQGYTIQGARMQLRERLRNDEPAAQLVPVTAEESRNDDVLRFLKSELLEIRRRLD